MMAVRTVYHVFCDSWQLYRKYIQKQMDDKAWEELIEETEKVYRKYGKEAFVKDLMLAVIDEIERKETRNGKEVK